MSDQDALLKQAISALEITSVAIRTAGVVVKSGFEPGITDTNLTTQMRAAPTELVRIATLDSSQNPLEIIRFDYACAFRYHDIGDGGSAVELSDGTCVVDISAVFSAYYKNKVSGLADDALRAFLAVNVGYHVWPYWRAYIQSHCAQANLPVPIIPFYKRPKIPEIEDAKGE